MDEFRSKGENVVSMAQAIRKIAKAQQNSESPVEMIFATVSSLSPLKVITEQKLSIEEDFLILTDAVRDYTIEITVKDWKTEEKSGGEGQASYAKHEHAIKGKKKITVHNALKTGEKVILLRVEGGQNYIVIGRVDAR